MDVRLLHTSADNVAFNSVVVNLPTCAPKSQSHGQTMIFIGRTNCLGLSQLPIHAEVPSPGYVFSVVTIDRWCRCHSVQVVLCRVQCQESWNVVGWEEKYCFRLEQMKLVALVLKASSKIADVGVVVSLFHTTTGALSGTNNIWYAVVWHLICV